MVKNRVKKDDKAKAWVREISSGSLDENKAFVLEIAIAGKGKVKIEVTFEQES